MRHRGKAAEAVKAFLEAATGVDAGVCEDEDEHGAFFQPGGFALHAVLNRQEDADDDDESDRLPEGAD